MNTVAGAGVPLRLDGVHKTLAGTPVLRDVGFTCPAGAITALLGPNGAGKTTSVAIATGLRRADTGTVEVFGRRLPSRAALRRLSLVPQEIGLPAAVTVWHLLHFVSAQRAESPFAPPVEELCERLGIGPLLRRRAGGLSGGQQRKVAVALGLLRAPGLLILDEATTSLDESSRATTWAMVREYVDRGGAALVTSHILADIESHADRLVALNAGEVVLERPLDEVRQRLGGSAVSVRLPAGHAHRAIARITAEIAAAVPSAVASDSVRAAMPDPAPAAMSGRRDREFVRVQWRTANPLPLVAAIARAAPCATDLLVRPIPLGELLDELAKGTTR
jgi:ABC-2 type transport system ATP-binding protein